MSEAQPDRPSWRESLRVYLPPKAHLWLLAIVLAVGFLRGGYWVLTSEMWSRVDEAQHYGYVESLAGGHGMPVVGEDKLQIDARSVAKHSPTLGFRSSGNIDVGDPASFGPYGELYEGGGYQGPAYYAALVPVYWLTQPFSTVTTIYALRFETLVIALMSIPLLYFLAREMFPKRPAIWLAAPAFLVAMQGFNGNPTSIGNDAAVIPMGIAALIPIAAAWRSPTYGQALIGGLLFGLAMLCKNTAAPVAVLALVVLCSLLLTRRASFRQLFNWGLVYAAAALAMFAPYLAWNFVTYDAPSASSEVNAILAPVLPRTPYNLDGIRFHFHNSRLGFWDYLPFSMGTESSYVRTFEVMAAVCVLVGLAVSLRRRAFEEISALTWAAIAFPLAFVIVLSSSISIYSEATIIVGRHLYVILGLFAIAVVAGIYTSLGARLGTLVLLALLGVVLIQERKLTDHNVLATYTDGILFERIVPVVEQPLNESYTTAESISASASCPVEVFAVAFGEPQPQTLALSSPTQTDATFLSINGLFSNYELPGPQSGDFTILLPPIPVGRESADRDPTMSLAGATGDPVVRLYCAVDDPAAFRFKQMFYPGHVDLSYSLVRAWADVWYWIGWALVAVSAAGLAIVVYGELRRSYNPSGLHK